MTGDHAERRQGRRDFLRKAGTGAAVAGAAWAVPQIQTVPAGAAPVSWYLEIDPATCAVISPTTGSSITCDPTGWLTGQTGPVNGADINWTLVQNNGLDCTQGFVLTVTDPDTIIVAARAEETCANSSPPGQSRCVDGTINGAQTEVTFPDNFNPEQCLYDVFRIIIRQGS